MSLPLTIVETNAPFVGIPSNGENLAFEKNLFESIRDLFFRSTRITSPSYPGRSFAFDQSPNILAGLSAKSLMRSERFNVPLLTSVSISGNSVSSPGTPGGLLPGSRSFSPTVGGVIAGDYIRGTGARGR